MYYTVFYCIMYFICIMYCPTLAGTLECAAAVWSARRHSGGRGGTSAWGHSRAGPTLLARAYSKVPHPLIDGGSGLRDAAAGLAAAECQKWQVRIAFRKLELR